MAKRGEKNSIETRMKISQAQLGNKNHMFGKKHSEETKSNMSKAHAGLNTWIKGRKLSTEHKLAISRGNLGKKISEETRAKMKIAAVNRNPSQWMLGRKRPEMSEKFSGENNPMWIEDRSLVIVSDDRQTDPLHKICLLYTSDAADE